MDFGFDLSIISFYIKLFLEVFSGIQQNTIGSNFYCTLFCYTYQFSIMHASAELRILFPDNICLDNATEIL